MESKIICSDCLEYMKTMEPNSVDAIVTDPPYLLSFMGKEWDSGGLDIPTSDVIFRSWLAGLIAGEGYFRIHKEKRGTYYACQFGIHMRADEAPMLRGLAKRVVAGDVFISSGDDHTNPMARWIVQSREDCWKIVKLLDGVPLYAKKQREYDLWRKALETWTNTKRGNRWHGPRDNSAMMTLYEKMKTLRPYDKELAESNFDPFGQPAYQFHYAWAVAALRIAKPGAHLLAFGGTRTFHRLTCAIEDAGWEIRDCLGWLYGSGFPKSHNVGLRLDKLAGHGDRGHRIAVANRHHPDGTLEPNGELLPPYEAKSEEGKKWQGWGTALKPAWEPIILARKPLDGTVAENILKWGTGAINVDGCRVSCEDKTKFPVGDYGDRGLYGAPGNRTDDPNRTGRWPANIIHDGSDEVLELFPETGSPKPRRVGKRGGCGFGFFDDEKSAGLSGVWPEDSGGSAARFFYCAKASRREREMGLEGTDAVSAPNPNFGSSGFSRPTGHPERETTKARNHHPTVKPVALMRYLCRLVTPPNGLILDPFCGSGSTGVAAKQEGFRFIGIDNNEEYCEIARKRIGT